MGRGHRGGGGRRGGSGRGGSGRGAAAAAAQPRRQSQTGAAPPSGEALRVELRAAPTFYEALRGRDCPVPAAEGSSSGGASPMGTSALQMREWRELGDLIGWFRDGIAADPAAELAFSPRLTKQQRASVHGTATAVGLGGLGTASRGVGEARRVLVLSKERAQRPELDEQQDHKAFWTWRWAGEAGLQVSRDEVGEMLLGAGLTPELQALWDKKAAEQKAVQRLCGAVVAGDVAGVAAALDAAPALLADRVFDVQSGVAPLHLAARESQVPALELLLARGADPEAPDGHGWTALQVARKFEQSDAEGALLRAGARDPDAGKSPLEAPLPAVGGAKAKAPAPAAPPAPAPAAPNGPAAAPPATAASALSDTGSQDVYLDSLASVCGTERDNLAAEVGSNVSDYADSQYQQPAFSPTLAVEEEGEEEREEAAAATDSERAQAEAVELAARAALEAQAAAAEAAAEQAAAAEAANAAHAAGAAAPREEEEEEEEEVEAAMAANTESAVDAFTAALKAAEAAEAAAEEADGMPGEEAAARAAAFRKESEAAVAAAAAAAVVAGDALEEALSGHLDMPQAPHGAQPPPSSAASVCGSEAPGHLSEAPSDFGSGALATAGSAASAAAEPAAAAEAAAAEGAARNGPEDLRSLAATAAERTVSAAKGAAAAAGEVASKARAELHARAPEWGEWLDQRIPEWAQWAQEHPGSIMAGAGLTAAALAGLLLAARGGRR